MNRILRRKHRPSRVRTLAVGVAALAIAHGADAMVLVKNGEKPAVKVEVPVTAPVALPDRNAVLVVDWVDTKNARLSIGGITYRVRGALPTIALADGARVNDIGYLKKGTHVRIQLASDAGGASRLTDVQVVAVDPSAVAAPTTTPVPTVGGANAAPAVPPTSTRSMAPGRSGPAGKSH